MALIDCIECGEKISESATTCPKCGCSGRNERYYQMLRESSKEYKANLKMALSWTLVVAAVLGGIFKKITGGSFEEGLFVGGAIGITFGWIIVSIIVGIVSDKELKERKKNFKG